MPKIRASAGWHPQTRDAAFAVVLAGMFAPVTAEIGTTSGLSWLWYAALHVPLAWRRRSPVIVFWTVCALAFVGAEFALGPSMLAVPLVAIYTVARHRPRRYLWPISALVAPFTVMWLWNGGEWWDVVGLVALFAASALLGLNVQTRRAYLAELEERALRLERERDQQAQLAVAAERSRIAREMHDIVAHNLAVMVALADGAAVTTSVAPDRATDMMEKVSATGREALVEIRRLVGLLRDGDAPVEGTAPAPQPGFDDVDELVDQVRMAGLQVDLTSEGTPGGWGPGAGLTVYRIVQEALTNTMKHAGAQARAEVRLRYTATGVELEVVDDGARRPAAPVTVPPFRGHGLTGMIERAAPYGGQVDAGPRRGTGWRVHALLRFDDGEVA